MFACIKYPGNIKPEKDIAFVPLAVGVGDKLFFRHTLRVGDMKLEYVTSRFNIKPE